MWKPIPKSKPYDPGDENLEINKKGIHKLAYYRYFQDYEEQRILENSGKIRIKRVYIGIYHKLDQSNRKWVLNKIMFPVLALISVAMFSIAALPDSISNKVWYVVIFRTAAVLGYLRLLWALYTYCTSNRCMTMFEYHEGVENYKKILIFEMCFVACVLVGSCLCGILNGQFFSASSGGAELEYTASIVALLVSYNFEIKMRYIQIQNVNKKSEDAIVIGYK